VMPFVARFYAERLIIVEIDAYCDLRLVVIYVYCTCWLWSHTVLAVSRV